MLRSLAISLLAPAVAAMCTIPEICIVEPGPNGTDSAPAIIDAFQRCGHNDEFTRGKPVFQNTKYTVKSLLNTTGLSDIDIDLHGATGIFALTQCTHYNDAIEDCDFGVPDSEPEAHGQEGRMY
ncbi:Alpha-L-rhamnosidase rgxB 3 [Seiridium cupressi]